MRTPTLIVAPQTSGSWGWTYDGERPHATIGYEADLTEPESAWLRLHYRANGAPVNYTIQLAITTPHYGGLRWWFICPLVRRNRGPRHRVAKLYLPPGGKYFGSRQGYGLTYTSCQESGKFRRLFPPSCRRHRNGREDRPRGAQGRFLMPETWTARAKLDDLAVEPAPVETINDRPVLGLHTTASRAQHCERRSDTRKPLGPVMPSTREQGASYGLPGAP